jgi:hypothetical protein
MARHDAEIAADVSDDGADRAAADLGGDLLGRGQADAGVKGRAGGVGGPSGGRSGGRRLSLGGSARRRGLRVQSGGIAGDPGFERLGAEQAPGDMREDQGDIAGGGCCETWRRAACRNR